MGKWWGGSKCEDRTGLKIRVGIMRNKKYESDREEKLKKLKPNRTKRWKFQIQRNTNHWEKYTCTVYQETTALYRDLNNWQWNNNGNTNEYKYSLTQHSVNSPNRLLQRRLVKMLKVEVHVPFFVLRSSVVQASHGSLHCNSWPKKKKKWGEETVHLLKRVKPDLYSIIRSLFFP